MQALDQSDPGLRVRRPHNFTLIRSLHLLSRSSIKVPCEKITRYHHRGLMEVAGRNEKLFDLVSHTCELVAFVLRHDYRYVSLIQVTTTSSYFYYLSRV